MKTVAPKLKLDYSNWRFFAWAEEFANAATPASEDGSFDGNWKRLIRAAEDAEDKNALKQYHYFTAAALELAERLIEHTEIERISLFGSLAKPPFLEPHPFSKRLRERGVHIFHTPKDIDLAIWLSSLDNLGAIRKTMTRTVADVTEKTPGICDGSVELFVFDHQSGKYLGRVCHFSKCPKEHDDCFIQGCGKPKHLKTMRGFSLHPEALSRVNSQILFERNTTVELPHSNLLAEIPTLLPEEWIEKLADSQGVRIERIVSTGHASPPGFWYDQDESEWVVVLQGEAILEFEDEKRRLAPGDYVLIPAHRKHRVSSTSLKEPTVWLAVFFGKEAKAVKKVAKKATKKKAT